MKRKKRIFLVMTVKQINKKELVRSIHTIVSLSMSSENEREDLYQFFISSGHLRKFSPTTFL